MTAIIIACFFICFLWKFLSFLVNDSEAKRNPPSTDSRRQMISMAMEKAENYNASSFQVGRSWIGKDGHEYVACSITVSDDVAMALAQDLKEEYGDVIEKIGITYNNNDMKDEKGQNVFNFYGPNYGPINGDVTNNFYGDKMPKSYSENAIRDALEKLMTAKNGKGELIFTKDYQWYGVMRVLSELHNYPSAPKDFEKTINNLNLKYVTNQCKYENFRKVPNDCPRLAKPNVLLWKDIKETASGRELDVIDAALKLMELLGIQNS